MQTKSLTTRTAMKLNALLGILAILSGQYLYGQDAAQVTRLLNQLQHPDTEVRLEAIAQLQTSLDPRIPDACLPLLRGEGDSIRRLAARAIGSRWHQIPPERVKEYTAALKAQMESNHAGLVNMARRGIALLTHDYTSDMLGRSKSKQWVIYERRGLPCLIDTKTLTEELLGFGGEAKMRCAYSNEALAPTVKWHPKKDMVAIEIIMGRKFSTLWIWVHGKGLKQLTFDEQAMALGHPNAIVASAGVFASISGWSGDSLDYALSYTVKSGEAAIDHQAKLRWNTTTEKLTVMVDEVAR